MPTVREFVYQSYRLISAQNPTTPLHGDDQNLAITVLNQQLQSYAATGLLITIAKTIELPIIAGQGILTVGSADYIPTPDITEGRLANMESAWLQLEGVTYPLIDESRNQFFAAWKYEPLQGLPRFIIVLPDTEIVRLQLYPKPSQAYTFFMRGKFQLTSLTSNDDMSSLPAYYYRYLLFAVAKDIAMYTGRAEAWTPMLEQMLTEARDQMIAASEVNLDIVGDTGSLLNGAALVRSGTY